MVDSTTSPAQRASKRVPAEWEPQRAVWIAWPHNHETWPGRFEAIPEFFRRFVTRIQEVVPVQLIGNAHLLSGSTDLPAASIEQLSQTIALDQVTWHPIPTNDCWIRDYGPTFVFDDADRTAIHWGYNAWGGKYPPWDDDASVAPQMVSNSRWVLLDGGLTLEGGALEWDGAGRLLTTPQCIVTSTRNPAMTKATIEHRLRELTGAVEIVWVDGGGLFGDDTDGHIDQLARFIDPQNVVVAWTDDSNDPNHAGLQANVDQLTSWGQQTSPVVTVHRLPIPPARFIDGTRVPESYCNFVRLGPDRILVPTFGHEPSDSYAIALIRDLAQISTPSVEVIGLDCRDLIWGLGALHCASCNEPY